MKMRRISKVVALALTLVMSLSMALYNNADVAKAASNTVTFKNGSTTVDTKSVNSGSAVANIGALEVDGKLFAGWFTQNVGDITDVASALNYAYDFSSAVNSNKTLYAGWINIGTGENSEFYLMGTQNRPVTSTTTAGLRFMTKITDNLVNKVKALNSANSGIRPTSNAQTGIGYGTVLTYADNLANGSMLVKDTSASTVGKGFLVVPAVKTYTVGSNYRIYTGMVVGIPEAYYSQHIAARPYITYADANGVTQTYYYTETSGTTHKVGGAYYLNYNEAVDNYTCNDTIDVEQPSTEAPTTAYVPTYTGGYNLTVKDIKWSPETPITGSQVIWTVTVMNDGDTDIPAGTTIGYQVQVDGSTSNITWCDSYNSGLKAGQSIELTCNGGTTGNYWTATQGSHSIMAWVDDVNRFTSEVNENDNQYTVNINIQNTVSTTAATTQATQAPTQAPTTQAQLQGYDLTVTNISWDSSKAVAGGQVVFTATVKNSGDTDIPAGTTIGYQLQIDGSTSAIWWCDTYNSGLKAGASIDLTCNSGTNGVNYWTATQGSHSVMAWVDDVNRFPNEINENNNQYTATISVGAAQTTTAAPTYPDMIITKVWWEPSSPTAGNQVTFHATIKNQGTAATPNNQTNGVAFWIDGNKLNLWSGGSYGAIQPGQSVDVQADGGDVTWTATQGSHSIRAMVDDAGRYTESNEDNNTWNGTINVSAPATQAPTQAPTEAPTVENNTSGITIYFYGSGWSSAYLWSWNGYDTLGKYDWPGQAFTKVSGTNNWWKLSVNASQLTGYVQETGGGTGCDKEFGTISGYGTYFVVYNNNAETLYTSQSAAESAAGEKISGGSSSGGGTTTEPSTEAPSIDSGSDADGRVVGYNVPSGKTTSSNVSMSANGVSVGVFDTTVNNTHSWVGYYPSLSSSRVAIFDFEGTAKVTLTVNYSVSSATVRPAADGITPTITRSGNTSYITFPITKAGQYSVELNGNLTDAVMIFASAIESKPSGNVRTISGEYNGDITVSSGQTLYIEGGAAVYGRIFCQSNSTVCGRGIIDGSKYDTWGGNGGNAKYPMSIEFASNVNISGVSVLNSNCWNYQIYNSSNVTLDNIKIVSARPNGDGVSIQSSSYVYVKNSFIRTWDDGVVLKNYSSNNTHHVYCDNVVFWTDLAQAMEIGVETNAGYDGVPANPAIYEVEFTNIDVIHELHKAAISIHNGDNAEIYNVKWENVTMDDCSPGKGDGWNYWLDFTTCYPTDFGGSSAWAHHWDGTGTIHDVTLRNIQITSSSNAGHRVWDYWASQNRGYSIYNITCENVYVNGSAFKY